MYLWLHQTNDCYMKMVKQSKLCFSARPESSFFPQKVLVVHLCIVSMFIGFNNVSKGRHGFSLVLRELCR